MDSNRDHEHQRHQTERAQLEALRETMQHHKSQIAALTPRFKDGFDPLIYPDLYSPTGFDIMEILIAIRRRPQPTFDIGAIDSSVCLLLCDRESPDLPIVYCTETFQKLCGYPKHEIMGRNCRFLQYPPPHFTVQGGLTSNIEVDVLEVGDDNASADESSANIERQIMVLNESSRMTIAKCVSNSVEGRAKFINYRYNGEKFWNLLTIIPIESGGRKYFVGLQADLGPFKN